MMDIGFVIVTQPEITFRTFAASPGLVERMLSWDADCGVEVLLMGRIYYREEHLRWLRREIEPHVWERCATNDASLVSTLYALRGARGLANLEGDFAIVCLDRRTMRLLALRDPMGGYPLYWGQRVNTIAVSTSIRPLIDVLRSAEPDPEYVADYLVCPDASLSELPRERTAYRNIQRLRPGYLLDVDIDKPSVDVTQIWDWRHHVEQFEDLSTEEAGQLIRERLDAAVRTRLSRHGGTASHFSGGFDSTGVALLAGQVLGKRGAHLHTLSLTYEQLPMLRQEMPFIEVGLEGRAALVPHHVVADDLLDFDGHGQAPMLDEPFPMVARFRVNESLTVTAARAGADTILGGEGADHLFDIPSVILLADLLANRKWRLAWRLAGRFAYENGRNSLSILSDAARQLVPARARDGIGPLLLGGRAPFEHQSECTIPPWFTRQYIRRYQLRGRAFDFQPRHDTTQLFDIVDVPFVVGDWFQWYVAASHGIFLTHPFRDPRVMLAAFGLRPALRGAPGQFKPVLAAALGDILPEPILRRRRKGHFGELFNGFARNRESLEALISAAPIEQMIDKTALIECLRKAALGILGEGLGVGRLRTMLSYVMWVSDRDAWLARRIPAVSLPQSYPIQQKLAATTTSISSTSPSI